MLINSQKNSETSLLLLVLVYSPGEENYGTFATKQRKTAALERHACMHETGRSANRHPLPRAGRKTRCQPAVPSEQLQATVCHSFLPAPPELCMGTPRASADRITETLTPTKQVRTRSSPLVNQLLHCWSDTSVTELLNFRWREKKKRLLKSHDTNLLKALIIPVSISSYQEWLNNVG